MLENFMLAVGFLTPTILLLTILGVAVGIVFGAIPGLSTTMAIALCLPLTFKMDMNSGVALLIGLYIGGFSGGLISAILLNVPGTAASIATCYDGHPMSRNGQAGKAMGLGIVFSFLGGLFSIIALIFISPVLAKVAIQFGDFEFFSLALFALTMIITMSSKNVSKNIISGLIGILVAMVGTDPVDGMPRFDFGITNLTGGFNTVAVMVGIFAVSELFWIAYTKNIRADQSVIQNYKIRGFGFSVKEFLDEKWNMLRSSVIGLLIGILPGIGGSLASIVSYNAAQKMSKTPEKFGTGINAGVVASETANNAAIGGAMIPMLSLGIPGDAVTAILIAAFTMKGVQPGPLMFSEHAEVVYFIFLSLIIANCIMLIAEFCSIRMFVHLLKIPKTVLFPIIILMCVMGSYGLNHRIFDVWTIFVFGVLGFAMKKWGYQFSPFILGFIVGPMAEKRLRQALIYSKGSVLPFFTKPISLLFLIVAFISVAFAVYNFFKDCHSASAEE